MNSITIVELNSGLWAKGAGILKRIVNPDHIYIDRNMMNSPWKLVYENVLYLEYAILHCGIVYALRIMPLSCTAIMCKSIVLPVKGRILSPIDYPVMLKSVGRGRAKVAIWIGSGFVNYDLSGFLPGQHYAVIQNGLLSIVNRSV